MPAAVSAGSTYSRRIAWFGIVIILIVGLTVVSLSWTSSLPLDDFIRSGIMHDSDGVLVLPAGTLFATARLEMTGTRSPVPLEIVTLSSQPSETSSVLEVSRIYEVTKLPAGTSRSFLIHMIVWGETRDSIASKYGTTVEAIMAVNYKLTTPVWAEYPIVIPVDTKDAAGLPAFKVYVVRDYDSISAESLASILAVNAKDFEYYNLCSGNCQFIRGDVLLVPRTP